MSTKRLGSRPRLKATAITSPSNSSVGAVIMLPSSLTRLACPGLVPATNVFCLDWRRPADSDRHRPEGRRRQRRAGALWRHPDSRRPALRHSPGDDVHALSLGQMRRGCLLCSWKDERRRALILLRDQECPAVITPGRDFTDGSVIRQHGDDDPQSNRLVIFVVGLRPSVASLSN
jgi:hypothetical protein